MQPETILFIVNPNSGNNHTDWKELIHKNFEGDNFRVHILELEENMDPLIIKDKIITVAPQKVIAVGGDGTIKLVAELILDKPGIVLGIIPAGSANGLAKELNIPKNIQEAIELCKSSGKKTIHLIKINDELCIHLSDVGFNAYMIKIFEQQDKRGMWGYFKASWKTLWQHDKMAVRIKTDNGVIVRKAAMVVIANATRYGSGALINPDGKLDDNKFEVIVVRKISFSEIFKMMVTHKEYDPSKTEVFTCTQLRLESKKSLHFQVDGEYLGKVNEVEAEIVHAGFNVIVPESAEAYSTT
jgi:diacylglycerol kinase (ATP)